MLPGLVWLDAYNGHDAARGLTLPALSTLLGRAQHEPGPLTLSSLFTQWVGQSLPILADARAYCDEWDERSPYWLMADPVSIRVELHRAILIDTEAIGLSEPEALSLIKTLNHHFAADGIKFSAPHPSRWYIAFTPAQRAYFTPRLDVVGEDINDYLPEGECGLYWNRFLNEVQMLLHDHPVNVAREERGALPVSSVWLWGSGYTQGVTLTSPCYDMVFTDNELLTMVSRLAQLPFRPLPEQFSSLLADGKAQGRVLVALEHALASAQYRDVLGWHQALRQLEVNWFVPILQALYKRNINVLKFICHGSSGFSMTLRPRDMWKFWRTPHVLAQLYS